MIPALRAAALLVALAAPTMAQQREVPPLQLEGSAAPLPWKRYADWNKAHWDNFNTLANGKLTPLPGAEIDTDS